MKMTSTNLTTNSNILQNVSNSAKEVTVKIGILNTILNVTGRFGNPYRRPGDSVCIQRLPDNLGGLA